MYQQVQLHANHVFKRNNRLKGIEQVTQNCIYETPSGICFDLQYLTAGSNPIFKFILQKIYI
jgi:hypothetical protein